MGKYLALGVAVITVASCGRRPKKPSGAEDSEQNQAILHKIQNYSVCLDLAPRIFELEDAYRARFATTPPTEKTENPVQATPDPAECLEGVLKSAQLEPHDAQLEHAANAYAGALTTLHALTTAERDAFDPISKKHAPARGAAIHPQLAAALASYDSIATSLFDQVFVLNRTAHEDQYQRRVKFDGHTFAMMNEELMLRAEDIIHLAAIPDDRLDALPVDEIAERVAALDSIAQSVIAFGNDNQKEAEELMKPYWPMSDAISTYLVAAKQLISRARQHVAYNDTEKLMIAAGNEKAVPGSPSALVDAYNKLCDQYYPSGQWPR